MNFVKKEYNGSVSYEADIQAELISISDKEMQNSNGTGYRLCTVKFQNINGDTVERTGMIYDGNYLHPEADFQIGQSYLTTVTLTEGNDNALIRVSHLQGAKRASALNDFGVDTSSFATVAQNMAATTANAIPADDGQQLAF